jgi:Sulfotransferase family
MKRDNTQWEKHSRRLIAVDQPRILYLSIPKCGCTFIKNVLWFLVNKEFHSKPSRIHDDDSQFKRAIDFEMGLEEIRNSQLAFTVVRNPVDRFLSLYFDKVIGLGQKNYVPLARTLSERKGLDLAPSTLSDHRRNLEVMIDWIEENLTHEVDLRKEAHWTPQSYRFEIMNTFCLKLLTVDSLSVQLSMLLSTEVVGVESIIAAAETNSSVKPVDKSSILNPQIRKKVNSVYAEDRRIYRRAKSHWDSNGVLSGGSPIPRFSELNGKT